MPTTKIDLATQAQGLLPAASLPAQGTVPTFVDNETPGGALNATNTAFTLANTPIVGSVTLYRNGILQAPGAGNDYTINAAAITMLTAPKATDNLLASYRH